MFTHCPGILTQSILVYILILIHSHSAETNSLQKEGVDQPHNTLLLWRVCFSRMRVDLIVKYFGRNAEQLLLVMTLGATPIVLVATTNSRLSRAICCFVVAATVWRITVFFKKLDAFRSISFLKFLAWHRRAPSVSFVKRTPMFFWPVVFLQAGVVDVFVDHHSAEDTHAFYDRWYHNQGDRKDEAP